VTGGGLPAQIWRETMLRINEGQPARPLPMLAPEAMRMSRPDTRFDRRDNSGRSAEDPFASQIRNLLGAIFGGN
jgi:membrane peptidoglycan carboxypeptidase